jgi:hypothetical protein
VNDPINHHYIPVFYLRQWCDAAGKVTRYYRPNVEVVASPITPENTGYEPHLYTLDGYPADQKQWIEKHYMGPAVDDPASKALQTLLAADIPNLTAEKKIGWTRFLMSLSLRDPDAVAKANADMRQALTIKLCQSREWYDANKTSADPATFAEWVESNIPSMLEKGGTLHLPNFIDNADIGTVILHMSWFTFDLEGGGLTLLTGDRPLIRTHGLKDRHCIVLLPLSPRLVFVATNAPETDRGLLRAKREKLVTDINARIVAQARRYVYGATTHHLRFVENRLAPKTKVKSSR